MFTQYNLFCITSSIQRVVMSEQAFRGFTSFSEIMARCRELYNCQQVKTKSPRFSLNILCILFLKVRITLSAIDTLMSSF